MSKSVSSYFDFSFFKKFLVLLLGMYYFHIAFHGITSPEGGYYNHFLDQNLNYIAWFRFSILKMAQLFLNLFEIETYQVGTQILRSTSGNGVNIWLPCLGLGIISFWLAFVLAQNTSWKPKMIWSISGLLSIWLLNCLRIGVLMLSMERNWAGFKTIDHHDLFNYLCYAVIVAFIYAYNRRTNPVPLRPL
jgi:exosortase/archaeosortase family protein